MPLADSLGAFEDLRRHGKIREIGLSQFTAPRLDEAMQVAEKHGFTRPCALQTWYNMVEREKLEGPLGDAAMAHGMGILPFYSLANGFLTGKYRSKDDLGKIGPRPAQRRISRRHGACGSSPRSTSRGRNRCGAGDGDARLDDGPARDHGRRSPARPASIS